MIVACEMARMSMKMHAYFREKLLFAKEFHNEYYADFIPDWALKKGITVEDLDKPNINVGTFTQECKRMTYFFFVPTLIYRDTYVYTKKIRWNFAIKHLLKFVFLVFYIWCIFKGLCVPEFKDTVNNPNSIR